MITFSMIFSMLPWLEFSYSFPYIIHFVLFLLPLQSRCFSAFFGSFQCRYFVTPSARMHRAHLSAADGIAVIYNSCNGVLAVRDYLIRCIPDF